jgi:hypothetical protein
MHEAATAISSFNDAQEQGAHPLSLLDAPYALLPDGDIVPSFEELTRCTWGTHVTVRGQPAKFHQAGVVNGRQVVIVLAGHNDILGAASWRCEPACGGEKAYYFDYSQAGLRIGTPLAAPLLREQAAASLRTGDLVLVNACTATFLCLKHRADELWLTLRAEAEQESALREIGADRGDDRKWGNVWRLKWRTGLNVRLVSARLPTFNELNRLEPGVHVTLGADAVPGRLQRTQVRDGTKRFVLVKAAPWLSVRQAHSRPAEGSCDWVYRIRFEEAGLRLAHDWAHATPCESESGVR